MEITFFIRTSILAIAVLIDLLLALAVFRNNPRSATNRVFGLLGLVIVLWLIVNYLSLLPGLLSVSLWLIRFSIFFATLMSALFLLFAHTVPGDRLGVQPPQLRLFGLLTLVTMVVAVSPLAFTEIVISNGSPNPIVGPGIGLFTSVSTVFSGLAVYLLFKKMRQPDGIITRQLRLVIYGIGIMLAMIIMTVLVPVVFFNYNKFVAFIPLYTIIFLGMTTLAIIRHRLFDIRSVIARSVAYVLMVTTFVVAYTAAVFAVSYAIFDDGQINLRQHVTYIALALIFSPTIYWLKRLFDRITSRLFFQDAYDSEVVLDQLSSALVGNIELEKLLSKSSDIIVRYLKSSFCSFVIVKNDKPGMRVVGPPVAFNAFKELLRGSKARKGIIVTQDLYKEAPKLYAALHHENVAVLVRLSTHVGHVGYILLGEKKNAREYTRQDIALLLIISDELAIASQNAMRFEEIQHFNVTLQEKVDDATRRLRRTNEQLRLLDETKDDFISMASHQLRTPLTSVKGYLSMVLEGDAGKVTGKQAQLLNQAFISSQRMVYLIADLLNVSRLRTGKFIIEAAPTSLAEIVEEEVGQLRETAAARELELTYNKPAGFPELMLDETKIRQVIMNFIDNAIYYTPAGGHITIKVEETERAVSFTVTDDGIGVPKKEQPHLFTKFYRAGNARQARPDGTGLGLFMAKKVIVAQGGSLLFQSHEGRGSTFGFTFAKAPLRPKVKVP